MVILGLGSNLGDRMSYLRRAVMLMAEFITNIKCSHIYESAALLPPNAPENWDKPFLNFALMGKTQLKPEELLEKIKAVELVIGREPRDVWAPREVDIDILAMEDVELKSSNLTIPHSQLLKRDFALVPFADLAPDWIIKGKTVSRWVQELKVLNPNEELRNTGWHIHV